MNLIRRLGNRFSRDINSKDMNDFNRTMVHIGQLIYQNLAISVNQLIHFLSLLKEQSLIQQQQFKR